MCNVEVQKPDAMFPIGSSPVRSSGTVVEPQRIRRFGWSESKLNLFFRSPRTHFLQDSRKLHRNLRVMVADCPSFRHCRSLASHFSMPIVFASRTLTLLSDGRSY
jgi:hypothetical protein